MAIADRIGVLVAGGPTSDVATSGDAAVYAATSGATTVHAAAAAAAVIQAALDGPARTSVRATACGDGARPAGHRAVALQATASSVRNSHGIA